MPSGVCVWSASMISLRFCTCVYLCWAASENTHTHTECSVHIWSHCARDQHITHCSNTQFNLEFTQICSIQNMFILNEWRTQRLNAGLYQNVIFMLKCIWGDQIRENKSWDSSICSSKFDVCILKERSTEHKVGMLVYIKR